MCIRDRFLSDTIFLGELSLDGKLRHIKGALPIAVEAKKKGINRIILPKDSANEAAIVDDIEIYGFETLTEVISFLNEESNIEKTLRIRINFFQLLIHIILIFQM